MVEPGSKWRGRHQMQWVVVERVDDTIHYRDSFSGQRYELPEPEFRLMFDPDPTKEELEANGQERLL